MDEVPKTLDWVNVHFECSLHAVFVHLREVVDSDVKSLIRNNSRTPHIQSAKFDLNGVSDDKFIVIKTSEPGSGVSHGLSVVFELTNQGIAVKAGPSGKRLFIAKPTITKSGECKLQVVGEGEPLELWQVSQKALTDLFFGP